MKKPLAIILLLIGASAALFALAFMYIVLMLCAGYIGVLIDIAVTLAAGMGIDRLRRLFRNKYGIKAPVFFLAAYLPSIIGSAVYLAVVIHLNNMGYFEGFLGGLVELLLGYTWIIAAAAFAAVGGLYLLISFIIEKKYFPKKSMNITER
ncbi:MAG: hypothetical protein K2O14_05060 [Oscillospiraceae bacterium]|nr:hypothetical protein [Oscillospiraceae bacterium]